MAFALVTPAARAVTVVNVSSTNASTITVTFSHTVSNTPDRYLVVGVSESTDAALQTVAGVTYGGVTMTELGRSSPGDKNRITMFGLLAPAIGTADVVVTLSAARKSTCGAISFSGVDQTSPTGTFRAVEGNSTSASTNVTSAVGDLVVDIVGAKGDANSLTAAAGQTEYVNRTSGTGSSDARGGMSTKAGAASVTMTWTLGASKDWSIGAVSLKTTSTRADVAVTKTGPTNVTSGTNFSYTITVTNLGPLTSTNIVVSDTLPSRAAFFSASDGGTHSGGVVTWPAFNLAVNAWTNLTVTITPPGNGSLTNRVSNTSDTYDPDSSNNDGSAAGAIVVTTVTAATFPANDNSSCVTATNVATRTWSHTVNSGNQRVLIVGIALADHGDSVTSLTYGGTALTRAVQSIVRNEVEIWYLIAPPVGTANIVANWTGNDDMAGWSGTFTNVDQTSPIANSGVADGNNSTPSVTISASTGDLVIDMVSANGDASSLSVGAGQTQICSGLTGTGGGDVRGASSYEAGASSVTMSWTAGASKDWDIAAIALRPGSSVSADVATTVSGATSITAGAKVTYTITVTNSGSSTSVCVSVTDTLPSGATFLSASGGGTESSGVVTWPAFTLPPNGSTTFTLAIGAAGNGTMTNIVSGTSLTYDPDSSNNDGTAAGAQVITSITGGISAGSDGLNCVAATNVATKTWSHTVNSGNNRILIVGIALADNSETVSSITYGGTALTRIAQSLVRNTVEVWYLIAPPVGTANVVANWTGNNDMVGWSGTFTNVSQTSPIGDYQVANGNNSAPTVTVSALSGDLVVDTLSANGDAGTVTIGGGQTQICSGQTGTGGGDCRGFSSYESGASSVTMSWSQTASKDWEIAAVVLHTAAPLQADIVTTKTGAATVYATSNITYTITVTNCGPVTGSNIVVSDVLPTGSTFVSASSGGTNASGTVYWNITNMAYAALTNLTVTVTAPISGTMTNVVSSTATTSDPDAANNNGSLSSAKVITTVLQIADVKTTKTGASSVYETSNLTYTVTVTNMGPNTATNVIVSDLWPTNTTFVSASSGGTNNNGSIIWPTMTNCPVGFTTNFTVTITAPSTGGSLTNVVSSTATSTDPDASNNNGTAFNAKVITTVVPIADVKTTKSGATTVYATSNLTYIITVTNMGPDIATNVIVNDLIPTNVTFVSASSGGTNGNGTIWWPTMTNCAVGFTTNFTVTITAPSSSRSLTNTVSSTNTTTDPDTSNNDGSSSNAKVITTVLEIADVKTTKTGATTINETSNLTYTVTVTNLGPNTATNVIVSDLLPTNVTFVSASSGGTNGNGTVWWPTMTNCAVGFSTNFTVTITAPSTGGSLTNRVSSTATSTDPDASNNDGSSSNAKVITTITPIADVKTTKTGATTAYATSNLTYTITITNMGPDIATNVVVSDLMPTNVTFVSASSGGTNGNGTVWWPTLTNFAIGATTNFTVTVTLPSSGSHTNIVSSTATTSDPDSSNNDGSSSNAKVITTVTPVSDLKVTKSGATTVTAGANLIYTITVTNLGPNNATNVVVTDTLPPTATFVSASSGGSYSAGVVTWPAMTNVSTTNFTVTITAPGSGPLTNSAGCTSSTHDPDASNSDGSASNARVITTVTPSADVETTKTGPTSAQGTSNITYTVTVTNLGPSTASNVVVIDTLPSGVTFVSASSGGLESGGVVTWPTLTNFANTAFTNFTVVVTLPASGSVTNVVSSTSDTGDPVPGNNNGTSSSAKVITTVVAALADIATSVSGPSSALPLTNITYTLTVTNMGPGGASNVVVIDTLPAGVTFVSASSGGLEAGGVVTWPTMTNFASAATTNFTVTVTVPDRGTLTNIVSSTSTTSDPVASNNDGSSASGQVITLILGVNVTGYVYLDTNKNGFKDSGEAGTGLGLYAKIYATTNGSGPALDAAAVDGTTGAYTLTNIYRGLYMVIIDNNNLLTDVTPSLPSGWTGTEMPAQVRTNVAVTFINVPNQNFGLIHSVGLSGRVFKDIGAGGGTANDGAMNGAETGLGGVTVRLSDSTGATVYDSAVTDGSGNYTLLIPNSVANGATLKVTETNLPVHLSTGGSPGDTGGSYDRASDTVTFTYASGASYSGVNFGDVPDNSFVNDGQLAGLPGSFVVYPHTFVAGSGGSLSLSVASAPSPNIVGWSQVLYRDANCNGALDLGEAVIAGAITVSAGDKVCILVKEFIPANAPFNAQDQLTVTAAFTWTGASPALSANMTHTDLTTVGHPTTAGLTLLKAVDKETALPGEVLSYTVTYENKSSSALTNIFIFDQTPAFTTFTSAGHGALPNSITGIAVNAPSVGASGQIKWTLTGSLAPASSGTVTFSVTVSQ